MPVIFLAPKDTAGSKTKIPSLMRLIYILEGKRDKPMTNKQNRVFLVREKSYIDS